MRSARRPWPPRPAPACGRRTGSRSRGPGSTTSGFCAVPRMKGRSGDSARWRCARTSSSGTSARRSSSESSSIVLSSCEVRKPSKKCTNGTRVESVAAWATAARSCASCDRGRREHRETGLADGHHVGVVAEDRQRLRGQRAGRDVEHGRGQLAGDLVHVRDHQQQPLRGGERRRQRPALQRAVQRTGRAALALHLHHRRHAAPDVRPPLARPLVGQLGHRRGRRDRVDAADLVEPVGDRGRGLVPVERRPHQPPSATISIACTGHCSKHAPQPVQRS